MTSNPTDQATPMEGLVKCLRRRGQFEDGCLRQTLEWTTADAIETLLAQQAESDKRIGAAVAALALYTDDVECSLCEREVSSGAAARSALKDISSEQPQPEGN